MGSNPEQAGIATQHEKSAENVQWAGFSVIC